MRKKLLINIALATILFYLVVGPMSTSFVNKDDMTTDPLTQMLTQQEEFNKNSALSSCNASQVKFIDQIQLVDLDDDNWGFQYDDSVLIVPKILFTQEMRARRTTESTSSKKKKIVNKIFEVIENGLVNIITLIVASISACCWKHFHKYKRETK